MSSEKIVAAILAGGKAKRFQGKAKGELELADGRTIVKRLLEELAVAKIDEIVIAANDPSSYSGYGCPIVEDRLQESGPLGGIEAALGHYAGRADAVLFLPCDLPGISARELLTLIAAYRNSAERIVVAQTPMLAGSGSEGDFFWHPLCVIVHIELHEQLRQAIVEGERCPWDLWDELGAALVRFNDAGPFFNINSPQDLAEWLQA